MARDERSIEEIEEHLRIALERYQKDARVRGDFIEAIFGVHHQLESGVDHYLESKGIQLAPNPDGKPLSFSQKVEQTFPAVAASHSVADLNERRNFCAHPGRGFYYHLKDDDVRLLARGFVELALALWPDLYRGPCPEVVHPSRLYRPQDIIDPQEAAQLRANLARTGIELDVVKRRSPKQAPNTLRIDGGQAIEQGGSQPAPLQQGRPAWKSLLLGAALLLPLPLLAGLGDYLWREDSSSKAWALAPGLVLLVAGAYTVRFLWRFARSVRLKSLLAVICTALVFVILGFLPFVGRGLAPADRAGATVTHVVGLVLRGVGLYAGAVFNAGREVAEAVLPAPEAPAEAEEPEATTESRVTPTAPGKGKTATPSPGLTRESTRTATPSPAPADTIAVGMQVVVRTGGAKLLLRSAPGLSSEMVVQLENGTRLETMDGPESADGYFWWQVRGEDGTGWCAANYLEPLPVSE